MAIRNFERPSQLWSERKTTKLYYLEDRTIQVRVGSTLSDLYDQEQGVPQGAILSTTLFNVKLNDIINCLDYKTDSSLYVDDFCICFRSENMRTIERHLKQCLNRIEDWATRNGFKFSKSKTQCVHFCQQRKIHNDPALYIYGSQIPVVAESKFLGVIFDRKLSFIPHIKYVKAKCLKALNLLKFLSHTSWGADRTTLLHLYRSLIRSKLDYGSIVYGSARKSYLHMLDTVHNQGLRLALGALFNVKLNDIINCLNYKTDGSLYVKLGISTETLLQDC